MSIKISNLPAASSVNNADLIPIVQGGTTKKAAANLIKLTLGTTAGTACEGDDARLTDSRGPTGNAGGDLTGSYPSPALTTTGVAALTYGGAAQVGVFAVDDKGRITGATSQVIAIAASQVASGITSAQIAGLSASQVGAGLTSAQITGISAAQVASGITSAQIAGLSASQVGAGITSAQIVGINVTQVNSLASGVSAFLQTPSSANFAAVLTDETGSGANVFATSPTIATPTINGYTEGVVNVGTVVATATLAITAGTVLTATLTASTACTFTMPALAAGKSFALYLKQPAATGNGTAAFVPAAGGTVAWVGSTTPIVTATAGRLDIFSFVSDGVKWYGNVARNFTY